MDIWWQGFQQELGIKHAFEATAKVVSNSAPGSLVQPVLIAGP